MPLVFLLNSESDLCCGSTSTAPHLLDFAERSTREATSFQDPWKAQGLLFEPQWLKAAFRTRPLKACLLKPPMLNARSLATPLVQRMQPSFLQVSTLTLLPLMLGRGTAPRISETQHGANLLSSSQSLHRAVPVNAGLAAHSLCSCVHSEQNTVVSRRCPTLPSQNSSNEPDSQYESVWVLI